MINRLLVSIPITILTKSIIDTNIFILYNIVFDLSYQNIDFQNNVN